MSVTAVPLQPVKKSYRIWLWAGIIAAAVGASWLAWSGTREQWALHLPVDQDAKYLEWHKGQPGVKTTKSGLQYQVLKAGSGPLAQDKDGAILMIEGRFRDGTVFQPAGPDQWLIPEPNPMTGKRDRIDGYVEGVKLMNKGAKYRFWIPSELAYGANPDNPRMRKNAMLVFDIEMTEHITAAELQVLQEQQMRQQQQMMEQMQRQGGAPGAEGAPEGGPPVVQ